MAVDSFGIQKLYADGPLGLNQTLTIGQQNGSSNRWDADISNASNLLHYEVTASIFIGASTDGFNIKLWGPCHGSGCPGFEGSSEPCCWYDIGIDGNGDIATEIEFPHPENFDVTNPGPVFNIGSLTGKWHLIKWVVFRMNNGVRRIQMWRDLAVTSSGDPGNNWQLLMSKDDGGDWLPSNYAPPDTQEIELRIRDIDPSDIAVKYQYVRDIGSGTSSGTGGGGTVVGATTDSNGVAILYSNDGNIRTDYNDRGSRNDLHNPPINCEYTCYFSGGGSDDVSAKARGGRHSDSASCDGCCYIPACPDGGGSPRCRTECPHPDYGGCSGVTTENNCSSITSGWKGFKLVVWNTSSNCVHWELWQDQGNNSSTPSNQWVRLSHSTDCNGYGQLSNCGGGPLLQPRGSSSQFTWRADDSPSTKWKSAVGLVAGNGTGSGTNPGTGSGGPGSPGTGGNTFPGGGGMPGGNTGEPSPMPGTPGGTGGGGGGNDFSTGTGAQAFASGGCAIASAGGQIVQAGNCGTSGLGGPEGGLNPGDTGGVGGATEPEPIVTVYKDLALLYNVRTDLDDNCTIQGEANIGQFEEIYSVQPIAGEYKTIFQSSTTQFVGTKLHSQKSELYNKKIRKVTVTMKRSTGVALTGLLRMEIRDRNGNIMHDDFSTLDPAKVGLNDDQYDFTSENNDYKLQTGDMILLSYQDGGDTTNHILIATAPGVDSFDGFNTVYVESQTGIDYDVDQLADFAGQIFI